MKNEPLRGRWEDLQRSRSGNDLNITAHLAEKKYNHLMTVRLIKLF